MLLQRIAGIAFVLGVCASAAAQGVLADPAVEGYITSITPQGNICVTGVTVTLTPKTRFYILSGKDKTAAPGLGTPYLGESVRLFGHFDKKTKSLTADYIHYWLPQPGKLAGKAIIDAAISAGANPDEERIVRADGYQLKINAASKMHWNEPLASLKDVGTNQWITYTGTQGLDGVVVVDEAEVWQNRVDPDEVSLRQKKEFDPAAVSADRKQGALARETFGIDPKKLPAHTDPDLQARVERVGQSLIPPYQKALPTTDPTRINFRFQVIDSDQMKTGWGLPSGIVQVPYGALTRLTSDQQIAALLADHIATVLEKQALMNASANSRLLTAKWASAAGSIAADALVPGLGIATGLLSGGAIGSVHNHIETLAEQQSGRVSLCLLDDAGYSVTQAPITWWLLAPKKPKPLEDTEMPEMAINLYGDLGTTWRGRGK